MGTPTIYKLYEQKPGHKMPSKHLTDLEYAAAIARFPRVCIDIIPINRKRQTIYLTRRKLSHPSGWWWIGGTLDAGKTPEEAAQRNLKREISLELPFERFSLVPHLNFYLWSERDFEPRDLGSHDIVFSFLVEPSEEEMATASRNLDTDEYEKGVGFKEFDRNLIASADGFNELARKIILDFYDELFIS